MITRRKAIQIRNLVTSSITDMDDISASYIPEAFPKLKHDNSLVSCGTRINWNGQLKKAIADLCDIVENNPDNAPALWEDINYTNGYRTVPETITEAFAFSKGEKGYWNDSVWESAYDNNVWNPDQFSAGWNKVTDV